MKIILIAYGWPYGGTAEQRVIADTSANRRRAERECAEINQSSDEILWATWSIVDVHESFASLPVDSKFV